MSAVLEEEVMEETRLGRLESDVAHIRSDVSDAKTDIREIRSVLGSLNAVVAALRDEMHVADDGLRLEMRTGFAELRHEIMRISLSLKIWMLSIAGTLLAVMAHGFKWL
jgi:predicted metal-dependent enzyme (double-stranded beta helix superfamily)